MNPIQTWKTFQDRSLYYQAVKKDGEESCWREIAPDYDRIAYPERQQEILAIGLDGGCQTTKLQVLDAPRRSRRRSTNR